MQAHYPLIQRVASSASDAANGTATQAGGANRYLLQANYTGDFYIWGSSLKVTCKAEAGAGSYCGAFADVLLF